MVVNQCKGMDLFCMYNICASLVAIDNRCQATAAVLLIATNAHVWRSDLVKTNSNSERD